MKKLMLAVLAVFAVATVTSVFAEDKKGDKQITTLTDDAPPEKKGFPPGNRNAEKEGLIFPPYTLTDTEESMLRNLEGYQSIPVKPVEKTSPRVTDRDYPLSTQDDSDEFLETRFDQPLSDAKKTNIPLKQTDIAYYIDECLHLTTIALKYFDRIDEKKIYTDNVLGVIELKLKWLNDALKKQYNPAVAVTYIDGIMQLVDYVININQPNLEGTTSSETTFDISGEYRDTINKKNASDFKKIMYEIASNVNCLKQALAETGGK